MFTNPHRLLPGYFDLPGNGISLPYHQHQSDCDDEYQLMIGDDRTGNSIPLWVPKVTGPVDPPPKTSYIKEAYGGVLPPPLSELLPPFDPGMLLLSHPYYNSPPSLYPTPPPPPCVPPPYFYPYPVIHPFAYSAHPSSTAGRGGFAGSLYDPALYPSSSTERGFSDYPRFYPPAGNGLSDILYDPLSEDEDDHYRHETDSKEVWDKYYQQIEESEGFDVIDFPESEESLYSRPLGPFEIDEWNYHEVFDMAEIAAKEYNDKMQSNFKVLKVEKVNVCLSGSNIYHYLTFTAGDDANLPKTFQAIVMIGNRQKIIQLLLSRMLGKPSVVKCDKHPMMLSKGPVKEYSSPRGTPMEQLASSRIESQEFLNTALARFSC